MRVDRTVDYVLRICPSNYMRVAVNNFLREIFEERERQRERRRGYKIGAFVYTIRQRRGTSRIRVARILRRVTGRSKFRTRRAYFSASVDYS